MLYLTSRFALEVAQKTLPFYKEYFQVAYPLPKIDLIAIADFAAGMLRMMYPSGTGHITLVARGNGELGSGDVQRTCFTG